MRNFAAEVRREQKRAIESDNAFFQLRTNRAHVIAIKREARDNPNSGYRLQADTSINPTARLTGFKDYMAAAKARRLQAARRTTPR